MKRYLHKSNGDMISVNTVEYDGAGDWYYCRDDAGHLYHTTSADLYGNAPQWRSVEEHGEPENNKLCHVYDPLLMKIDMRTSPFNTSIWKYYIIIEIPKTGPCCLYRPLG